MQHSTFHAAFAENADFTVPDPLQVTITAGPIPSSPVCVPIMATEDTQIEGDHGFTLSINQPSLSTVTVGSQGSAVVTITDNDGIFKKIHFYFLHIVIVHDGLEIIYCFHCRNCHDRI